MSYTALSCPRLPRLFFGLLLVLLFCLCCFPVLSVSTPPTGFPLAVMGLVFVRGVAAAPTVPAVAPPLFSSFVAALSSAPFRLLRASGSYCLHSPFPAYYVSSCSFQSSSAFFRVLWLRLLLPVFLLTA